MTLPEKVACNTATHGSASPLNSIGAIPLGAGKLTQAQVDQVLQSQQDVGLLFGDAAIKLGFVRPQDVEQALARQFEYPFLIPGQNRIVNLFAKHENQFGFHGLCLHDDHLDLLEVLSCPAGSEALLKLHDLVDLSLPPIGPTPPNPGDSVARVPFSTQIQQAMKEHDVVFVDRPAAMLGKLRPVGAFRARGALMARRYKTRIDAVRKLTYSFVVPELCTSQ